MNMSAKLNVDVNVNGGMDLEAFGGKVVLSDDDIHERIIDAVIDQRLWGVAHAHPPSADPPGA